MKFFEPLSRPARRRNALPRRHPDSGSRPTRRRLARHITCLLAFALVASHPWTAQAVRAESLLVSKITAERAGLQRAWFTQVELDSARARVTRIVQHDGTLFVTTDGGQFQAIDAETGATLWAVHIGRPIDPILGPTANSHFLALANGSHVYLLRRDDGRTILKRRAAGAPAVAPALSDKHMFVATFRGRVEAYPLPTLASNGDTGRSLDSLPKRPAWTFQASGPATTTPVIGDETTAWPTENGHLNVARLDPPDILYRVETHSGIVAAPTYRKPYWFVAATDGFVYAVNEATGNTRWRFAAGDPVYESPVVIRDRLYVCPAYSGMICLDVNSGQAHWRSRAGTRFLAASPTRIYATDPYDRLILLDAQTGTPLGMLSTGRYPRQLVNRETDRVYLGSDSGLLQCLHETALDTPLRYLEAAEVEKEEPAPAEDTEEAPAEPAPEVPPAAEPPPGDAPDATPPDEDTPPADAPPADDPFAGDDNPFD